MKPTNYIFLFLILIFPSSLKAQSPEKVLAMEMSLDTLEGVELVLMQCRLAFVFAFRDMPKAYQYGNSAIALAEESNDLFSKCNAYRNMGIVYDIDAKGDSALIYFQKSLDFAYELDDSQQIGMGINNLGMYHWNKGLLTKAIDFFIDANAIGEKNNDPNDMSGAQNNICLIYNELNQPAKALPYCEQALKLRRQYRDTMEILQSQNNLAISLQALGRLEEANSIFIDGLNLSQNPGFEHMQDEFYTGLGSLYLEQAKFREAKVQNEKGIALLEKADDLNALHKQYATAAEIENKLENYSSAIKFAKKGLHITDSLGISSFNASLYQAQAEAYFGQGKKQKGLAALKKWSAAKDSTFSKNNAEALAVKEVEYETQKKEQQILLQQTELEKKSAQNNLLLTGGLAGFLLLSLAFLFWLYRSRLEKQKELQAIESKARNDQFMAVLAAEEKERQRLARDLHDGLGQVLSTARMNVSALEEVPLPEEDEVILNKTLALIDRAVNEMRNVSHDLMPRVLIQSGLIDALEEIKNKVNLGAGVKINIENTLSKIDLPNEKEIIIYRVLQEILNNMLKHAKANEINIELSEIEKNYKISLNQDKGRVSESILENGTGIGWLNIKSRLALIDGAINISNHAGEGMQFNLHIPK